MMGETVEPVVIVSCRELCGRVVFEGGRYDGDEIVDVPFDSGKDVLTEWADEHCDIAECPHKTAAREKARSESPEELRREIDELRALLENRA